MRPNIGMFGHMTLRGEYTVLIVTHNMQQAARVSDYTAFMYLGKLIEVSPTGVMFLKPSNGRSHQNTTQEHVGLNQ